MFRRLSITLVVVLLGAVVLRAQNPAPRIWQGIYTTAQAERGKATFNSACLRCHAADLSGTTAPALKGDRFQSSWGSDTVESLFVKIRDTMPPNFGTIVNDQAKLDVVTYILQTNGFPAGQTELVIGSSDLASAQILKQGEQANVQNFSLVSTVGCLARGPDDTWVLTRTADPTMTREDVPSAQTLASAASLYARNSHLSVAQRRAVQPRGSPGAQDGSARADLQRGGQRAPDPHVASDGRNGLLIN